MRALVGAQRWRQWCVWIVTTPRHPLTRPGLESVSAEDRAVAEELLVAIDTLWPPESPGPAPAGPVGLPA